MPLFAMLVSGSLLFLLDQSTKVAVQTHLFGSTITCGKLVHIRHVVHRKKFYGHTVGRAALILVWFAALASVLWLRSSGVWFQHPFSVLGLGCALGGAAGNLADILRHRHVVDFIDLGCWPVFNLADIGIVGGLIAAFWS
jgi:signal peptidase II